MALTRAQLSMLLEGIDWRSPVRTATPERRVDTGQLANFPCGVGESRGEVALPWIRQRGLKDSFELRTVGFNTAGELQDLLNTRPACSGLRPRMLKLSSEHYPDHQLASGMLICSVRIRALPRAYGPDWSG